MVWSDGRYGMGKTAADGWDGGGVDGLADWYAPHVEAWGRVCAPSATLYVWNTAEGLKRLDPMIRSFGWTWRVDLTWLKTNPPSQKGQEALTCWADFTEVCGVYQRNAWDLNGGPAQMIGHAAGADEGNWIRHWLAEEWDATGLPRAAVDEAQGTATMGRRHYFARSQWLLPTWDNYQKMAAYAAEHGTPRERPHLVHPSVWPAGDLRASYDHLRAEYEDARCYFNAPTGETGNVWTAPMVPPTRRLRTADGETHECEKPIAFASRAILASSRVGDTILDPFAGTNRIAVACRRLPEEERRRAIGIEMDQRWLAAVRPSLIADHAHTANPRQPSLFAQKAN